MSKRFAVIGVGNMAKAIIAGIQKSGLSVSNFYLYDINPSQYEALLSDNTIACDNISSAIENADCVLLSVKPQNFPEVLKEISLLPSASEKLYITIAAGITVSYVCEALNAQRVIRVLPNLPMLISMGVSAVCYNDNVAKDEFDFVVDVFSSAGSVIKIDEKDMNKIIGVTSSSPAYVFKFIKAICDGATLQGLDQQELLGAVCDMIIDSAHLIKSGFGTPSSLANAVASKGGTTERALSVLDENNFEAIVANAMLACTQRADELGAKKDK